MFLAPADIYETHYLVVLAEASGVPLDAMDLTLERRY